MPAPRPSIIAITVANDGQVQRRGERGQQDLADHHADQRADDASRAIAAPRAEQQRQQDDRDRDADELADGASCSEARSIRMPRSSTWTAPPCSAVSAASISASPSSFSRSAGSVV